MTIIDLITSQFCRQSLIIAIIAISASSRYSSSDICHDRKSSRPKILPIEGFNSYPHFRPKIKRPSRFWKGSLFTCKASVLKNNSKKQNTEIDSDACFRGENDRCLRTHSISVSLIWLQNGWASLFTYSLKPHDKVRSSGNTKVAGQLLALAG